MVALHEFNEFDYALSKCDLQITEKLHQETSILVELIHVIRPSMRSRIVLQLLDICRDKDDPQGSERILQIRDEMKKTLGPCDQSSRNDTWEISIAKKVCSSIIHRVKPVSKAARLTGILANTVVYLNRNAQSQHDILVVPPIYTAHLRPRNPWTREFTDHLKQSKKLRVVYDALLRRQETADGDTAISPLTLLFGSAIFYGGLLHKDLLAELLHSLSDMKANCMYLGGQMQVEMSLSWHGQPDIERRFWYPDPLSSILLLRFQRNIEAEINAQTGAHGAKSYTKLIWTKHLEPLRTEWRRQNCTVKSLSQLLIMVAALYRESMPAFMVAYMRREILSSSLKRHAFARVHGTALNAPANIPMQSKVGAQNAADLLINKPHDNEIEPVWLADLRSGMHSSNHRPDIDALKRLAEHLKDQKDSRAQKKDRLALCVTEFALHLLKPKSGQSKKRAISSIQRMVGSVATRLWRVFDGKDPASMSSEELQGLYRILLEELEDRKRLRHGVGHALLAFHQYLVDSFDVDPIDSGDLDLGPAVASPVNANVITEAEYQQMRGILQSASRTSPKQITTAAELVLMLAFRCGMRHGEIAWLHPTDLVIDSERNILFEIEVRNSENNDLKSKSSVRRIPANLLLSSDEQKALINWLYIWPDRSQWERHSKANKSQRKLNFRLFHWKVAPGTPLPCNQIFDLVFEVLRKVVGDNGRINLHHGRHSAATHLFLRFHLDNEALQRNAFAARLLGGRPDAASMDVLYQKFCGCLSPTRKALYALGQMLGHASADVTLESYLHCLDILQQILLSKSELKPQTPLLIAASGMERSGGIHAIRSSKCYELLMAGSITDHEPLNLVRFFIPTDPVDPRQLVPPPGKPALSAWIENLSDFLKVQGDSEYVSEELASEFGYDRDSAQRRFDKAKTVLQVCRHEGKPIFDREILERGRARKDIFCPKRPHLHEEIIHTLAAALQQQMVDDEKRNLIRAAIEIWIERAQRKGSLIHFKKLHEADQAQAFSNFLRLLEQPYHWIRYQDPSAEKKIWPWQEQKFLESDVVILRAAPQGAGKKASTWISIEPHFTKWIPAAASEAESAATEASPIGWSVPACSAETVSDASTASGSDQPDTTEEVALSYAVGPGGVTGAADFRYVLLMATIYLA